MLAEVGTFLGSLYRADLVWRLGEGMLDARAAACSGKVRKKDLGAQSWSRWAGSITGATQDQFDLAVRALAAERAMLVAATGKLALGADRTGRRPHREGHGVGQVRLRLWHRLGLSPPGG